MKAVDRQVLIRLPDTVGIDRVTWLPQADVAGRIDWQCFRADGLVYLRALSTQAEQLARTVLAQWAAHWPDVAPDVTLLEPVCDVAGASTGQASPWQYVVETDVTPEMEAEFNRWYAQEHLPGLAAVPGTVRAQRWLAVGQTPRYHAIYDLQRAEVFGSPAWVAVRATPWSDQVRPFFRNTRRTLFQRIALD